MPFFYNVETGEVSSKLNGGANWAGPYQEREDAEKLGHHGFVRGYVTIAPCPGAPWSIACECAPSNAMMIAEGMATVFPTYGFHSYIFGYMILVDKEYVLFSYVEDEDEKFIRVQGIAFPYCGPTTPEDY